MKTRIGIKALAAATLVGISGACASAPQTHDMSREPEAAGLWRQTCSHCHNLRPAPEFTAAQWEVIVAHMRTHGDLTKSQAGAIAAYLRSVRERSSASP